MTPAPVFRQDVGGWRTRWDADRAERAARSGDWTNRTIADFAAGLVADTPDRILLIDGDRALTCRELYECAKRLAGYFERIGLSRGRSYPSSFPIGGNAR
jgi:non-ribosomal peptide synthetase component E (peptide arylation enzyme)